MRPALRWSFAASLIGAWLILGAPATSQQSTGQVPAKETPPGGQAQQPPPQPPKPVFRTGAELVRVDVAVLDRKGVPVSSLTAADFELQEDGVAQEIRTFQFVQNTGQAGKDDDVSLTIRSRSHAEAEAAKDNVRLFLIFWDEYHIGQMVSANRARGYLTHFVRTAFGPTDIVGFMDPLTPIDAIEFTRDRLELAEHVRKLVGRSGVYSPDAERDRGRTPPARGCRAAAIRSNDVRGQVGGGPHGWDARWAQGAHPHQRGATRDTARRAADDDRPHPRRER